MFRHIWQQLTEKMVDDLRQNHLQAITKLGNGVQAILYENVDLQGEILTKDQEKTIKTL